MSPILLKALKWLLFTTEDKCRRYWGKHTSYIPPESRTLTTRDFFRVLYIVATTLPVCWLLNVLMPFIAVTIGILALDVTNFWLFKHRISSIGELVVSAIAALIMGTFGLLVLLGLFTKTQTNDLTHRNTRNFNK
jgi:hypothetical protein